MTIEDVDQQVAEFCKRRGYKWERKPTQEYVFSKTLTTHLSRGVQDNKRAYSKDDVTNHLNEVSNHFESCPSKLHLTKYGKIKQ